MDDQDLEDFQEGQALMDKTCPDFLGREVTLALQGYVEVMDSPVVLVQAVQLEILELLGLTEVLVDKVVLVMMVIQDSLEELEQQVPLEMLEDLVLDRKVNLANLEAQDCLAAPGLMDFLVALAPQGLKGVLVDPVD